MALVCTVIESLDDDGYLRGELEELATWAVMAPPIEPCELTTALRLVQSFDPAGVGARDLAECLCLQIRVQGLAWPTWLPELISLHLPSLARGDTRKVARLMHRSIAEIDHGWSLVRQLDPRPGLRHDLRPAHYVRSDVVVSRSRGDWSVRLDTGLLPGLVINDAYVDLFHQHRTSGHAAMANLLQEARWALRNVRQRSATILAVAQAIVRRQKAYLDNGPLAMRPLALRDIALDVGMHESTVSRVTNNKFLQSPHGLIELKAFFSRPMQLDGGGNCSTMAIRQLVHEIITAECPDKPLSDVQIAERLARQGMAVARRTVTKYRQMLKLPPVEQRRLSAASRNGR
jgi:RNA polymerase sigma-54 factor